MIADHLMTMRKVGCTITIILICLVLLASCVYPIPTLSTPIKSNPLNYGVISQSTATVQPSQDPPPEPKQIKLSPTVLSPSTLIPYTPTPVPPERVPAQYDLDAIFDYYAHSLAVSEKIAYTNLTTETLPDLILMVEPNRWYGDFVLSNLAWGDGNSIKDYKLADDQLSIPLPQPLKPGEDLELILEYQLTIPVIGVYPGNDRPLPYGFTEQQTNIVDWYPYVAAYRKGEGWMVHPHWSFGEHQVYEVANYNIRLTLAEPVQDLVIAASAPALQDGDSYTYQLKAGRTFAISASTEYIVQSTSVGDVKIYSYAFSYDKAAGEEVLRNTADAVKLYSDLIMPYPHASLSVVEANFLDGMEYDGLYFLGHGFYDPYDGTPMGYLTLIAAHETAHQWWYGIVGSDQALEPWLDEAMSTYMELLFYENYYGDYPPGSGESLADWWRYSRVDYYGPSGWVDGSIYDFGYFRPYRDAIYLNGAKFLDDLRSLIGDQAFLAFLKDYADSYANRIASSEDFFTILKKHTSQNLDGLLAEYFRSPP